MEGNSMSKKTYLNDFTYTGHEMSVSEAKEIMSKFANDNGSVDLYEDVDGVAQICLNNPQFKNAINGKMMLELDEIVNKLDNQYTDCIGVILYGANGNFCSGGDLNLAKRMNTPELGYAMSTYMSHILDKFKRLHMITVAYIDGTGALGGGAEITTACDYRLMCSASDSTAIGFVHAKMGIVPAWGSTGRLASIVGARKACDLLLDSRLLGASEAADAGLVDGTVATLADATSWLRRKTRYDANVIRAVKRTLLCHDRLSDPLAAALAERRIFAPLWGGTANAASLAQNYKHKK